MTRVRSRGQSPSPGTLYTHRTEYGAKAITFEDGHPVIGTVETVRDLPQSVDQSNLEWISDVVGKPGHYNPVSHYKHYPLTYSIYERDQNVGLPPEEVFHNTTTQYLYRILTRGGTFRISGKAFYPTGTYPPNPPGFPEVDWTGLVTQVGDQLHGRMKSKSNILVTLGEGLKTLAMLKSPFKAIRKLSTHGTRTIKDLATAGASTYLEYKYGWRQLLADVREIVLLHQRVAAHTKYLNEHVGKTVHLSASQVDNEPTVGAWKYKTQNGLYFWFRTSRVERIATFSCRHVLDEAVLRTTKFQHYLDGLGIDKVAEAVWDLIPYSFVVDWFINFKRILDVNSALLMSDKLTHVGHSQKVAYYGETAITTYNHTFWNGSSAKVYLGLPMEEEQLYYKLYTRSKGFPPASGTAGWFGSLSISELASGAALIVQRI